MTALTKNEFHSVLRAAPLAAALVLGACGDPQPGLETPEREKALERCDVKLKALASNEMQLQKLCDCTTGRLAQHGFTLGDLSNENRDRAMQQVSWCMTQVGAVPLGTPGKIVEPEKAAPVEDGDEVAADKEESAAE